MRDNTNLLLGPSSSIKLDRFVYGGPSQPGAIAVNLVKGALRFATGDADKKAYVISTPTAAMGVRGTVLKIVSDSSKTLLLLDEGGAIACTRKAAHRKCLELTEPNQVVVVTVNDVKWAPPRRGRRRRGGGRRNRRHAGRSWPVRRTSECGGRQSCRQ